MRRSGEKRKGAAAMLGLSAALLGWFCFFPAAQSALADNSDEDTFVDYVDYQDYQEEQDYQDYQDDGGYAEDDGIDYADTVNDEDYDMGDTYQDEDYFGDVEYYEEDYEDPAPSWDEVQQQDWQEEQPEEIPEIALVDRPLLEPASEEKLTYWQNVLALEAAAAGSDGELIMSRYIAGEMEAMGYKISAQNFHEGFLNKHGVDVPCVNIIAERGANCEDAEKRTGDILIICAHYDAKADAAAASSGEEASGEESTEADGSGEDVSAEESTEEEASAGYASTNELFAGDKSGAAVALELARIFSKEQLTTDLCFVFLSGEEDGWFGSDNFAHFLEKNGVKNIVGVLSIERAGFVFKTENLETPLASRILTVDGEQTKIGSYVQKEGLSGTLKALEEAEGAVQIEGGGDALQIEGAEGDEESGEPAEVIPGSFEELLQTGSWEYKKDTGSSEAAFAVRDYDAAAVTQVLPKEEDIPEQYRSELSDRIYPSLSELIKTTNILAAAIGQMVVSY